MVIARTFGRQRLATNLQTFTVASAPGVQTSWSTSTFTISVDTLRALGAVKLFLVSCNFSGAQTINVKQNGVTRGTIAGDAVGFFTNDGVVTFPINDPNIAQTILLETQASTVTMKSIEINAVVVTVI